MSSRRTWRCFHCDEVFYTASSAGEHFGAQEDRDPGCALRVQGGELGLLRRVRELEEQLALYLSETNAVEVYLHGLLADHARAVRTSEEEGYNRGVLDMSRAALAQTGGEP